MSTHKILVGISVKYSLGHFIDESNGALRLPTYVDAGRAKQPVANQVLRAGDSGVASARVFCLRMKRCHNWIEKRSTSLSDGSRGWDGMQD